jgi:pimeloyl-ACP methyl ester carboxylesterase
MEVIGLKRNFRRLTMLMGTVLMLSAVLGTQFVATVSAKKPIVNHLTFESTIPPATLEYTQVLGTLGGADYELLIPDNWNGILVLGCRGYSHEMPEIGGAMSWMGVNPTGQFGFGRLMMINHQVAFAYSTFGTGGFCVKEGMIRTHQLTEYIMDNYEVTGEVYLVGFSMGGLVACLLGEKYPNLYDGVLDVCGAKDVIGQHEHHKAIVEMQGETDEETAELIREYLKGPPASLPAAYVDSISDESLLAMQVNMEFPLEDKIIALGGTPESKPKAYQRISATYNAEIQIPVVSIIGGLDSAVPLEQHQLYYEAVSEAGSLNYYSSYIVASGAHVDLPIFMAIFQPPTAGFMKLRLWVEQGIVPPATGPPIS